MKAHQEKNSSLDEENSHHSRNDLLIRSLRNKCCCASDFPNYLPGYPIPPYLNLGNLDCTHLIASFLIPLPVPPLIIPCLDMDLSIYLVEFVDI